MGFSVKKGTFIEKEEKEEKRGRVRSLLYVNIISSEHSPKRGNRSRKRYT